MKYDVSKREIILDRELSNLDKVVLDFVRILRKHIDYVIMAGYVSIILGRTRTTEDVDLFIRKISFEKFVDLYYDLKKGDFFCINAESPKEIFSYLEDGYAIRFSREQSGIPNFEVKFPKSHTDEEIFDDFITVILPEDKIKISSLERHIAFKRYFLRSDKDFNDALHVEELFRNDLDYNKINKLKKIIESMHGN